MVHCMRTFKDFYKQYVLENRRVLIAANLVLFVLLPIYCGYVQVWNYKYSKDIIGTTFIMMVTILFIALSILLAIYNFRFLYKKNHNELYFSLPIERNRLFLYVFFSGFLTLLLSLYGQSLIVLLLIQKLFAAEGMYVLFLGLELFVFYSIATAISVRSNHIFDTLAIGAGYLLLPLAVIASMNYVVYSLIQKNEALHFIGIEAYELVPALNAAYLKFISPVSMVGEFGMYFYNLVLETTAKFDFMLLIYWLVIAGVCFYLAYVSFYKRKVEESQETTNTVLGYPLLVNLFALCALCMSDAWFEYLLVFVFYCLAICFSKRKIKISPKNIAAFVIILCASIGFSIGTNRVDLLNYVEIIPEGKYDTISATVYGDSVSEYFPELTNEYFAINITIDKEDVSKVTQFLDKMYEEGTIQSMNKNDYDRLSITFNGKQEFRHREFYITKKGLQNLKQFMEQNPNIETEVY